MDFDALFHRHRELWDDTYLGLSALVPHREEPGPGAMERILQQHSELTLTVVPNDHVVTLKVEPGILRVVPQAQWQRQTQALMREALRATCELSRDFLDQELPRLAQAFLQQFKDPVIAANSSSASWSSWKAVTDEGQDMLLVAMDRTHLRFLLGIVPD